MMRSIKEAAEAWEVSPSLVRKWIAQGRIKTRERPGPGTRQLVIVSPKRPAPRDRGELTAAQRASWPKGERPGTAAQRAARRRHELAGAAPARAAPPARAGSAAPAQAKKK